MAFGDLPLRLNKADKMTVSEISSLLIHQLNNYWTAYDSKRIEEVVPIAMDIMEQNYCMLPSERFFYEGKMVFSPMHSVTWSIFLYRVSKLLALRGDLTEADAVYYLNKIMNSVDWYHQINLPIHFMAEHPLGSILGRAKYGDYLFVYQGTTVGGSRHNGELRYPELGDRVVLYANATVLGSCKIGKNVIISANSYLIDETIPDNCIVFGSSPNLIIKERTEEQIYELTSSFWK